MGTAVWIVAIPVAFVLLDLVLRDFGQSQPNFNLIKSSLSRGRLIIYLPGILADGVQSSRPVVDTWLRFGDVLAVSYDGKYFHGQATARAIAKEVHERSAHYDRITIIGSSLGGMLTAKVLKELRADVLFGIRKINVIVVDAPTGASDFTGPNPVIGTASRILPHVLRFVPTGPLTNPLGNLLLKMLLDPPKDENIEHGLDKEVVKKTAIESMSIYPFSYWRDQLVWMAKTGSKGLGWSVFDSLRVVYLMCTRDNVTVKQPQAANKWRQHVSQTMVVEVDSTHCGYLERSLTWNTVFEKWLR